MTALPVPGATGHEPRAGGGLGDGRPLPRVPRADAGPGAAANRPDGGLGDRGAQLHGVVGGTGDRAAEPDGGPGVRDDPQAVEVGCPRGRRGAAGHDRAAAALQCGRHGHHSHQHRRRDAAAEQRQPAKRRATGSRRGGGWRFGRRGDRGSGGGRGAWSGAPGGIPKPDRQPRPRPQAANAAESLPAVAGDQAAVANPNLTESKIALRRAEVGRKMPAQVPSLWASRAVRPAARRGHRASVSVPIFMRSGRARQGA
jgi:hypothetical protein